MGNGRKTEAPCGHPGEIVIGTYAQCLRGCEKLASDAPPIEDQCPFCMSKNVDLKYKLDIMYLAYNPKTPMYNWRCWDCGKLRMV